MMASRGKGTLYTGVTSDLVRRVHVHRNGKSGGFSTEHRCVQLVWFGLYEDMASAIAREKQIKGGSRAKKLALIEASNGGWRDLYADLVDTPGAVPVASQFSPASAFNCPEPGRASPGIPT